ncbi:MAG: GAF domain-containing sensor histidine kinase [Gemmatimonadales bacterium]
MPENFITPLPASTSLAGRLERLVTASVTITTELSLEGVLQGVANIAAEIIGARYCAVGMLAPNGRTLETFTTYGISPAERASMGDPPKGHGILGLVIHEGRTIRLRDLTAHAARYGFPANHPPMKSFMGVPIMGKRGVLGDLYLTEKIAGEDFTAEDEHLANLLASKAAAAIENARLHEQSARLLEEVQQLHRSRERFFAMVNHELRNSLAAVYGWAEMLVRRKDPQSVPRAAYEVLDSAEGAISLINDLLDLSRMDEDRLRPVIAQIDCAPVVRQAVNRVTPAADGKGISVQVVLPPSGPICGTDHSRVEQILVNLLNNAIKHSPAGSRVRLSVQELEQTVVMTIEDEGPGIAAGDVERIFDIYQTKAIEEGQGTGLGLPLSRRLARLLGGELRAISRSGGGGCFVLELPLSTG